jgi:hypothetical protein
VSVARDKSFMVLLCGGRQMHIEILHADSISRIFGVVRRTIYVCEKGWRTHRKE